MSIDKEYIITEKDRNFYVRLGNAMRDVRVSRGVSVAEVAAAAGISAECLIKYENAELAIPVYQLIPIMQYFDFPPELELGLMVK